MRRKLLTLLLFFSFLPFTNVIAQEFMPFLNSPYAGVTGVQLNPASIAGSKYKFDVTVFGASGGVHNDLLTFSRSKIIFNPSFYTDMWKHRDDFWNGDLVTGARNDMKHYLQYTNGNWGKGEYGGYLSAQLDLLHLMYSFSDRFSMALGYSVRAFSKANDIPEGLVGEGLRRYVADIPSFTGLQSHTVASDINAALFQQVALSAAYTLMNGENHKLKLGLTGKLIFGGKTFFAHADRLSVDYDINRLTAITGEAGKTTKSKIGFGGDIGLEYEYQPNELKGNKVAEYRLKLGVSLLDVGSFKSDGARYETLQPNLAAGLPHGVQELMDWYGTGVNKGEYTMALPMVLTGQVDYNFGSGFFLNFTPYIAFNQSSAHKLSKFTSFNLTPHYELKNFGVSVPMQYDQYGKFTAGLGIRAWRHLWLGSNTILKNLFPGTNKNYSADFHVMLKIPILKAESDRDADGLRDSKDDCPDIPGLKKFNGCPDSDGDGIPDNLDRCPYEAGPESTQGCPDRDGDGIIDKEDRCPDQPGPASLQGCPDTDGDGIADIDDACPTEAGPKATRGCPDRDGDGVADKDDRCPDQPGTAALQGCPDRDGDGVADIDDKCPDVAGPKENFGCPIDEGIKNIEFDIDKTIIRPEFTPELDKVVKMLMDDSNATITIVGHTDNTFTRPYNMNLSKRRAESVKNYLVKNKVAAKRIKTQYFGPDKPIATNDTAEGRQKNRRAEIAIAIK